MNTAYKVHDFLIDYTPSIHIGNLEWFNIANCARERMRENVGDSIRWRNERKSFYTALNFMHTIQVEHVKCEG